MIRRNTKIRASFYILVIVIVFLNFPVFSRQTFNISNTILFLLSISIILLLVYVFEMMRYRHKSEILHAQSNLEQEKRRYEKLKEELNNAETLFHRFWEISVDGMRLTDEKGEIMAVNEAFCTLVHMTEEQLLGQSFMITYDNTEHEDIFKIYRDDLNNNALKTHFERERRLWDGKTVWLEFSNSFLELPGYGKIVLSIINDITKRKLAEFELLNSEKRFRMLFNNANDAVFVNQFNSGTKFGPFIEVNNLACYRLGYSRDELLYLNPYDTFPQRFLPDISRAIEELQKTGHTIFEIMQVRKDRRQLPVEISAHLFELDGQPSVLSIARDITERKRVEHRLNHTSQRLRNLASRLQAIREEERTAIAREIHDELGQSLTVLKIQTVLLTNKLKSDQGELREKITSIIDLIDQTVESVQKISAKLRPGILDELGLIPAIEWQSQEYQKRTGIRCELILPGDEININGEMATAIFRIFQEALTNVARHAQAKKVSIILKQTDQMLTLEITDNGRGISAGQSEDPNALGLLGMKERALVFGGQVKIHGVAGSGTNVKVEMPLVQSQIEDKRKFKTDRGWN